MGKFGILSIREMLLLSIMFLRVSGTDHTVGGPTGWDVASDMRTWSSKAHFMTRDTLVFVYKPDHDVVEVGERGYEQCQIQSPIHTHGGGKTVIPLMNPGTRYFVSGKPSYCFKGLKIQIDVLLENFSSSPRNETGSCATAPIGSNDQVKSPDATPNLCRSGGPSLSSRRFSPPQPSQGSDHPPRLPSYDYPPTEFPQTDFSPTLSPSHNGNGALTVKKWVLYLIHYWYVLVLVLAVVVPCFCSSVGNARARANHWVDVYPHRTQNQSSRFSEATEKNIPF